MALFTCEKCDSMLRSCNVFGSSLKEDDDSFQQKWEKAVEKFKKNHYCDTLAKEWIPDLFKCWDQVVDNWDGDLLTIPGYFTGYTLQMCPLPNDILYVKFWKDGNRLPGWIHWGSRNLWIQSGSGWRVNTPGGDDYYEPVVWMEAESIEETERGFNLKGAIFFGIQENVPGRPNFTKLDLEVYPLGNAHVFNIDNESYHWSGDPWTNLSKLIRRTMYNV